MLDREHNVTGKGAEKLFNFRPFFFSAIFLCLGIIFYFLYHFKGVSTLWLLLLIPCAGIPFCFSHTRRQVYYSAFSVCCMGIAFFVGFFAFSCQIQDFFTHQECLGEQYVTGKIVEIRLDKENTTVLLEELYVGAQEVDGKLIAYLPLTEYENIKISDELFLHGKVYQTTLTAPNFVFKVGDLGEKVRFYIYPQESFVTGTRFDLFLAMRTRAENAIEAGMDDAPASVTRAVLFGNTKQIDEGLYDNIRSGGIAHIFAVSGLHVGTLSAFVIALFSGKRFQKVPKIVRLCLLAILLYLYAGICGFSASVLRAMVMCLVLYASRLFFLRTDMLESLGLAGLILLIYKPSYLFEVGFQLSFCACLGLAFLSKPIGQVCDELKNLYRKYFPKAPTKAEIEAKKNDDTLPPDVGERVYLSVRSFLSASLGAQIFTVPILLHYFGYVSGWSLFLNALFVPLMGGAFAFLLCSVLVASLCPVEFALVILYLPNLVWSGLLLLFQTIDFSQFSLRNLSITSGGFFTYYAGCLLLTDKWNVPKKTTMSFSAVCFGVFFLLLLIPKLLF